MMPGQIKTRVAVAADAAAIASLHAESWRAAYRGMLSDAYLDRAIFAERTALWQVRLEAPVANQYVVVAEVDGGITGFACTYGGEDEKWGSFLDNLHVAVAFKRRGIGAELMEKSALWSQGRYPEAGMYLWVLESNAPAMRFYEKLGGVRSGEGEWMPPDGGSYRKFRYAWERLDTLLA